MTQQITIIGLDLQLFGDGSAPAAGSAGGTSAAMTTGVTAGAAAPQQGVKQDLSAVVYGKQPAAAETPAAEGNVQTPEEADKAFEALIKGQYKEQYNKRVSTTVQNRVKGMSQTVEAYNALQDSLSLLAKRYGVDPSDAKALARAIEDDDAYYEDEADERGISVDELKRVKKMERENAELKDQIQQQADRAKVDADIARWNRQAEEAKRLYPQADFQTEWQNPQMQRLLMSGIDFQTAYTAIHNDEIYPQMAQYVTNKAQAQAAAAVRANAARPAENGMGAASSAVVKSDVSMLTRADREEISRRVQRGEKIAF